MKKHHSTHDVSSRNMFETFKNQKLILLLFIVILSCATQQNTVLQESTAETEPKLLFLNYTISKQGHGEKNIQFTSKTLTDGKLKAHKNIKETIGDLECIQMNKNFEKIKSHYIKNPLVKIVEYINDNGDFEKKIIELASAQFSVRLQLHPETNQIVINEIINSEKETKKLIQTKLN